MAVTVFDDLVLVIDTGTDDILTFFRVTAPNPARTVRFSESLAVPDKTPNNQIQDTGIGVEFPAMVLRISCSCSVYRLFKLPGICIGITGYVK